MTFKQITLLDAAAGGLTAGTGVVLFAHETGWFNLLAGERAILLAAGPSLTSAGWLLFQRVFGRRRSSDSRRG